MKNMNTKKITTLIVLAAALVALPACNDFLDEMPDNRTELDSSDKITSLLGSAYSEHTYPVTCEYASDNVDETALVSPAKSHHFRAFINSFTCGIVNSLSKNLHIIIGFDQYDL